MYKPTWFNIQELVTPHFFNARGEKCWWYISPALLVTLDKLREAFGPCTINNWHSGGSRQYSGLRLPGDQHYRPTSMHSFGMAADCVFQRVTAEEAREYIRNHGEEFPLLGAVEEDVSWLHVDVRSTTDTIWFKP